MSEKWSGLEEICRGDQQKRKESISYLWNQWTVFVIVFIIMVFQLMQPLNRPEIYFNRPEIYFNRSEIYFNPI